MPYINYTADLLKHYVRKYGWLPACQQQKRDIRSTRYFRKIPLRYFTLCAAEAMDVFMLERAGVLTRSEKTGRLEGVFFCERDPEDFGKIAALIGSPERGFQGDFEDLMLFVDDTDTQGRSILDDGPYPENVRKKLRVKDAQERMRKAAPFDILNLDFCGVMFPPGGAVIAPLLKALMQTLRWQTEIPFPNGKLCEQFTLFLTSRIDPSRTNGEAIDQLASCVSDNLNTNMHFHAAFVKRYGHADTAKLEQDSFAEFFCLALPKFITKDALFQLGWEASHEHMYLYNRVDNHGHTYQIMQSVAVYKRIANFGRRLDAPSAGQYTRIVTTLANKGVEWVESLVGNPYIENLLRGDLTEIVKFREETMKSLAQES